MSSWKNENVEQGEDDARDNLGRQASAQESLRAIVRVDGLLRRLSERHFARIGLSAAQWGVLRSLMRLEERGEHEPRMHELGTVLLVQPPSLSATLDRMEKAGWVLRRNDPADRRTRLIALSPRGRRLLKRGLKDHDEWAGAVMGGLDGREQELLVLLLAKLGRHLHDLVENIPAQMPRKPASPRGHCDRNAS